MVEHGGITLPPNPACAGMTAERRPWERGRPAHPRHSRASGNPETPVFPGEPTSIVLARQRRIRDSVHGLFNVSYKIRSAGGLGTFASSRPSTLRQARRLRRAALRSAHYATSLLRSSLRSGTRRLFASYPLAPLRPQRLRRLLTVPQDGTEGENRDADEPSAAFVEEVSKRRPAFARLAAARILHPPAGVRN